MLFKARHPILDRISRISIDR